MALTDTLRRAGFSRKQAAALASDIEGADLDALPDDQAIGWTGVQMAKGDGAYFVFTAPLLQAGVVEGGYTWIDGDSFQVYNDNGWAIQVGGVDGTTRLFVSAAGRLQWSDEDGVFFSWLEPYAEGSLKLMNMHGAGVWADSVGYYANSPDGSRYKLVPPNGGGAATWVAAP